MKVYGIWGDSYSSAHHNNNMLLYSMYNPVDSPIGPFLVLSRTSFSGEPSQLAFHDPTRSSVASPYRDTSMEAALTGTVILSIN